MADAYPYTFNARTRIGEGACSISQGNVESARSATYMLDNYWPACPMTRAIEFATSQPDVNYTGSHHVGMGGCNIDQSSDLEGLGRGLMQPKCRISLQQRPFATVPFLGRGKSDAVLESRLQQGELGTSRKSVVPASEATYETSTPLIPSLQATVANPANLVEGVAARGWIRGGVPSRELVRDEEHANDPHRHEYG
jgi:hypothetical protein